MVSDEKLSNQEAEAPLHGMYHRVMVLIRSTMRLAANSQDLAQAVQEAVQVAVTHGIGVCLPFLLLD